MTADASPVNPRTQAVAIGIDVGSTTVKAVVVDPVTKEILWSDYLRHQTKQAEFVLAFLERIAAAFPSMDAIINLRGPAIVASAGRFRRNPPESLPFPDRHDRAQRG